MKQKAHAHIRNASASVHKRIQNKILQNYHEKRWVKQERIISEEMIH